MVSRVALRHFLLIYDIGARVLEVRDLGEDAEAAAARYSEVEEEFRQREGFEVVLIGADSIETIQETHAHYFETGANGDSLEAKLLRAAG